MSPCQAVGAYVCVFFFRGKILVYIHKKYWYIYKKDVTDEKTNKKKKEIVDGFAGVHPKACAKFQGLMFKKRRGRLCASHFWGAMLESACM